MQTFFFEAFLSELNTFLFQFITNKSIGGLKVNIGELKVNPHWVDQESEALSLCFQVGEEKRIGITGHFMQGTSPF